MPLPLPLPLPIFAGARASVCWTACRPPYALLCCVLQTPLLAHVTGFTKEALTGCVDKLQEVLNASATSALQAARKLMVSRGRGHLVVPPVASPGLVGVYNAPFVVTSGIKKEPAPSDHRKDST